MTQIRLFEKQLKFYNLKDREALLEAGLGYGKSRVASLWFANQTQIYPKTKWIMAARDYKQLKTAVDAEFEFYLHDILGMRRNRDYIKTSGSPIHYRWVKSGSEIYGFGAHNYDTSFRSGNYSGAWGDEVDFWAPQAVKALRGRIRVKPELVRWTSSPYGYNHVYEDFYIRKVGPVINATSYENPTLSKEYFNSLKTSYDELYFRQEVLAERLNITAGRIYYAFDRDRHVKKCEHNPDLPIYIGIDFNVDPMTASVGQIKNGILFVFDEFYLRDSNTPALASAIEAKYGNRPILIPDSTGNKRSTTSPTSKSDILILKNRGFKITPGNNPYRVDRYAAVNGAFANDRVVLSPRCKYTIKDLESVTYKEGSDQPDTTDKLLTHSSDNLGYLIYKTVNPLRSSVKKYIYNNPR